MEPPFKLGGFVVASSGGQAMSVHMAAARKNTMADVDGLFSFQISALLSSRRTPPCRGRV